MVINIAHRGSSFYHTENTRSSILAALRHQADMIEVDVRATKDDKLVLFHDATMHRLARKFLRISSLSYSELKRIQLRNNEHILDLEEFLDLVNGKIKVNLELKVVGFEKEVLRELKKRGMLDRVIISSENFDVLRKVKKWYPSMKVAYVARVRYMTKSWLLKAKGTGAIAIHAANVRTGKKIIDFSHSIGLKILPYAVNSPSRMKYLIALGVDGIFTDRPDLLRHVLISLGKIQKLN